MYKHILVPVSLDQDRNTKEALRVAHKLLDQDGTISAIHVDEPIPNFATTYLPKGVEEERVVGMEVGVREALGDAADVKHEILLGNAGQKIVEYAGENEIDCIVVASHRPGLQDYFLGSTAARVVRHAHCAVHVVR
ncbi:MAG: universal stress protein [Rhodobacteraceae bacterium]|nr:universal stress protein [Paracoccaceae bacterium]